MRTKKRTCKKMWRISVKLKVSYYEINFFVSLKMGDQKQITSFYIDSLTKKVKNSKTGESHFF